MSRRPAKVVFIVIPIFELNNCNFAVILKLVLVPAIIYDYINMAFIFIPACVSANIGNLSF